MITGPRKGETPRLDSEGNPLGYSRAKFYTGASDDKGHHDQIGNVKFPSNIGHLLDQIVNSDKTPYRSRQDFARDAMYHHAVFLLDAVVNDPKAEIQLKGWLAMEGMKVAKTLRVEIKQAVDEFYSALSKADAVERRVLLAQAEEFRDGLTQDEDIEEMDRIISRYL